PDRLGGVVGQAMGALSGKVKRAQKRIMITREEAEIRSRHPQRYRADDLTPTTQAGSFANNPRMRSPQSQNARGRARGLFSHVALVIICTLAILPFAWMVSTSLKSPEAIQSRTPHFWPTPVEWHNYVDVFHSEKANILLWTRNTLIIAVLGVTGTTLSSALVA